MCNDPDFCPPECHFLTSLSQNLSHIKIKAKFHKYLVKVSQMTRVPQVEVKRIYPIIYFNFKKLKSNMYKCLKNLISKVSGNTFQIVERTVQNNNVQNK